MRSHNDGGRRLRCTVHHVPLAKRTSDFGRDMVLPGGGGGQIQKSEFGELTSVSEDAAKSQCAMQDTNDVDGCRAGFSP